MPKRVTLQNLKGKKKAKKEEEKALKQQKGEEARAAFAAKMEAMTDAERAEYEAVRKANREKRMKEAEEAKAKKTEALRSPYSVVLDLEFVDLMTEKESRSMAKQLTYCYSANIKAAVPLCLYFTGLDGEVGEALLNHFDIAPGSQAAHAFSHLDYVAAAEQFGRAGGFAHIATLVKRLRADRQAEATEQDYGKLVTGMSMGKMGTVSYTHLTLPTKA